MACVRFIGDLHLGHKAIPKFSGPARGGITTVEEHDAWIVEQWNSVVSKNDTVMVLGDVCFDRDKLPLLSRMKGNKHLILGNHDKFRLDEYAKYFSKIHGFMKYKGLAWISHAPVHPRELRNCVNIHGHVHSNTLEGHYYNVSVENNQGKPVAWEEICKWIDSLTIYR